MTEASNFIWYELMTPDPAGAAAFYGAVVGWSIASTGGQTAGGVDYRMIGRSDGGNAGGVLALNADMLAGGARPGWLGYLEVSDVDARIEVVRAVEQELITTPDEQFRFHSGVPAEAA